MTEKPQPFYLEPDQIIMMQPGLTTAEFSYLQDPFPSPYDSIRERWIDNNVVPEMRKIRVDLDGICSCGDKRYRFGALLHPECKEVRYVLSEILPVPQTR